LDLWWSTKTLLTEVIGEAAGARVHGGNQDKRRRECERHLSTCDCHMSFLQRLTQHLEHVAREFRKFVQEQNSVMCHAHFAWTRDAAATNKTRIGDRVMGRAERPRTDKSQLGWKKSHDRMNSGRFKTLFKGHRRKNRRDALRKHGFSCT